MTKKEMDDLDLRGLRVFREVIESGSFTAAADRLGMAPPMVSKHVARLERKLGARLLHRTSRRMSLTEAGAQFLETSRQALDLLDGAVSAVGQAQTLPRGELKISAPVWCANAHFARLLADYRKQYPDVRLDLHLDNHLIDLVAGGFDLALRMTDEPAPGLIARPLCPLAFHLVATPEFLRTQSDRGANGVLRSIGVVMPNYLVLDRLKSARRGPGTAIKWDAVMKSNDTNLTHQAVRAGIGAAFLPGLLVKEELIDGHLVHVPGPGPRDETTFAGKLYAVYVSRRHMPPKLRSFIDFLVARLGATA